MGGYLIPAEASIESLKAVDGALKTLKSLNHDFYEDLLDLMFFTHQLGYRSGYLCKVIMNEDPGRYEIDIGNSSRPRVRGMLKQLLHEEIHKLKINYPDTYVRFAQVLRLSREVGYDNIFYLARGRSPEELKGLSSASWATS